MKKPTKTMRWASHLRYDRAYNKERSFHEAGHAVVDFLLGRCATDVIHIDMRINNKRDGRVRRRTNSDVLLLSSPLDFPQDLRQRFRRVAIREAVAFFAGPAAQWRIMRNQDEHWYETLYERGEDAGDGDLNYPLNFARKVTNSESQAWRLLDMIARWTDELVETPKVWKTIEGLAKSLPDGRLMAGSVAHEIMSEAWGNPADLPVHSLGRKWRWRILD